MSAVEVLI